MATPRLAGATLAICRPPMASEPEVMSSRPATMRRSVDLPQPDGPTKTQKSPSAMSRSIPLMI